MPLLHSSASVTFVTPTLAYIVIADRAVFDALPLEATEGEKLWYKALELGNVHMVWQWYKPTAEINEASAHAEEQRRLRQEDDEERSGAFDFDGNEYP